MKVELSVVKELELKLLPMPMSKIFVHIVFTENFSVINFDSELKEFYGFGSFQEVLILIRLQILYF